MGARDGCVGEKFFGVHTTGAALMAAHTRNREHETECGEMWHKNTLPCAPCVQEEYLAGMNEQERRIYIGEGDPRISVCSKCLQKE